MQDETTKLLSYNEWTVRYRLPVGPGPHPVLLLLHGWTGDENVMWVFASRMSRRYLMLAPRGLYQAPSSLGGFGWHDRIEGTWPRLENFYPSVAAVLELLDELRGGMPGADQERLEADYSQINLMGFSQGAAMSYAFALTHPEFVQRIAGLAGFLPEGVEDVVQTRPLRGRQVFMAHGAQDETVPVQKARQAAELLKEAGAEVTYCEADVGHKLSTQCFKGLEEFFP